MFSNGQHRDFFCVKNRCDAHCQRFFGRIGQPFKGTLDILPGALAQFDSASTAFSVGPGFVKRDMPVDSNPENLKINSPGSLNPRFELTTMLINLRSRCFAIEQVNVVILNSQHRRRTSQR